MLDAATIDVGDIGSVSEQLKGLFAAPTPAVRMRLKAKGHSASPRTALNLLGRIQKHTAHVGKPPFGGPEAVLAYLSRYTHRVAISNHRLVSADAGTVAFRWKDYRIKRGDRMKVMALPTFEFIRRFLVHVLPSGFHRIRHAGFLANGIRRDRIEAIRRLIDTEPAQDQTTVEDGRTDVDARDPRRTCPTRQTCPKCSGAMIVIETFTRGQTPKSRAPPCEDAA